MDQSSQSTSFSATITYPGYLYNHNIVISVIISSGHNTPQCWLVIQPYRLTSQYKQMPSHIRGSSPKRWKLRHPLVGQQFSPLRISTIMKFLSHQLPKVVGCYGLNFYTFLLGTRESVKEFSKRNYKRGGELVIQHLRSHLYLRLTNRSA